MHIEIWSDIACPWCLVGKRRFERALERFPHAGAVEVTWRSFQLNPDAPAFGEPGAGGEIVSHLAAKYGGGETRARAMIERMHEAAATEGLEFDLYSAHHVNTFDAHRLLHLARELGLQDALKERLLMAQQVEGKRIDDPAELQALAVAAGLPADRVREVLVDGEYASEVRRDIDEAHRLGVNGVPFFVIDRRYGISGAQPTELFERALAQAWEERAPALVNVGAGEADACGPDGCAT